MHMNKLSILELHNAAATILGCGKTTLLKCMVGKLKLDSGKVILMLLVIQKLNFKKLKS